MIVRAVGGQVFEPQRLVENDAQIPEQMMVQGISGAGAWCFRQLVRQRVTAQSRDLVVSEPLDQFWLVTQSGLGVVTEELLRPDLVKPPEAARAHDDDIARADLGGLAVQDRGQFGQGDMVVLVQMSFTPESGDVSENPPAEAAPLG